MQPHFLYLVIHREKQVGCIVVLVPFNFLNVAELPTLNIRELYLAHQEGKRRPHADITVDIDGKHYRPFPVKLRFIQRGFREGITVTRAAKRGFDLQYAQSQRLIPSP
jgi:hypothetical protein